MRNMIFLAFFGLVIFVVTGWFLDWYNFTSVANSNGRTSIQFEIDRDKIGQDLTRGREKLDRTIDQLSQQRAAPQNDPWNWTVQSAAQPTAPQQIR